MDIHYFLMTCSIITTVLSFPSSMPLDSTYLEQEIEMCGEDLVKIANNLCIRHLPNVKFFLEEFHQEKPLLAGMCCVQICTVRQIYTEYCLGQRTESSTASTVTIPPKVKNKINIFRRPRPMPFWYPGPEFWHRGIQDHLKYRNK